MSQDAQARSFTHGVHPEEHKDATAGLPIERMPFRSTYVVPLAQSAGQPPQPVVRPGERVVRGQTLARAQGFVSVDLHSPVTGQVRRVDRRRSASGQLMDSLVIEADPFDPQRFEPGTPLDPSTLSIDEFTAEVQSAGLVGMGGAAFPSHVKYKLPEGKTCQKFVINGCECEPYLTCDDRMMIEHPDEIVRGTQIVAHALGAERSYLGVELNKPAAIEALRGAAADNPDMEVTPLRIKYPQGAEKMLIEAIFGQEVPATKLPIDIGIVVNNVGTMAAVADWFDRRKPLIERAVTVSGKGVTRPANLMVPIGTSVRDVLDHCGLEPDTREVILGGPMMGQPIASLDVPVTKGTSGILAFTTAEVEAQPEMACIRCGKCLEACANILNPSRLARLARAGRYDEMERSFALDCMECGACTYSCPSGVPIVHLIRAAKKSIWQKRSREQ